MNSKFSKKLGTGIIFLLTALCFIPAMAGAFTPGDGRQGKGFGRDGSHRPALGIWRNPQMVQNLELTLEQVKQLRDADFTFREKRLGLKAELDRLRLQMEKAFADESVDPQAVLSTAEKIADLKGKMFMLGIESRLSLRKLLNADQIENLKQHIMEQKRSGPWYREKRIPGHPGIERLDN